MFKCYLRINFSIPILEEYIWLLCFSFVHTVLLIWRGLVFYFHVTFWITVKFFAVMSNIFSENVVRYLLFLYNPSVCLLFVLTFLIFFFLCSSLCKLTMPQLIKIYIFVVVCLASSDVKILLLILIFSGFFPYLF